MRNRRRDRQLARAGWERARTLGRVDAVERADADADGRTDARPVLSTNAGSDPRANARAFGRPDGCAERDTDATPTPAAERAANTRAE